LSNDIDTEQRPIIDVVTREAAILNNQNSIPFNTPTDVVIKFLEPESEIYIKEFNRNLQLGQIAREEQPILQMKAETSKLLADVPVSQGQFLFGWMAGINLHAINFKLVSGNSVDGFGRKSIISRVNRQETKDNTVKGGVSGFFDRNQQQN